MVFPARKGGNLTLAQALYLVELNSEAAPRSWFFSLFRFFR